MRDFTNCDAVSGVERIAYLISRLTVLAPDEHGPLDALIDYAALVAAGDVAGAYRLYHTLARKLITCGARRVSGDLLMDYLLSVVVEREHPFAVMAAAGRLDEPEGLALRADLSALGELATLTSGDLVRMAQERKSELQMKSRYPKDDISAMSTALWSGKPLPQPPLVDKEKGEKPRPQPMQASSLPPEAEWLPFRYGEAGLHGEWAADEALEEVYARLMKSPDWKSLADDLWNLFATCGSGRFLRSRAFALRGGELECVGAPQWLCPVSVYDRQRTALSENVIAFMRAESDTPVIVYGPASCGKTAMMCDLAEDFPELRMVFVDDHKNADLGALMETLRAQPLRFLLLFDALDGVTPNLRALIRQVCETAVPGNVLIAATARELPEAGLFPLAIELCYPRIAEFTDTVCELVEATENAPCPDHAEIRSMCVDYQVDAHEKLTMAAAVMLAEKYAKKQN